MRGERLGVDVLRKPVYGSSPHARGTHSVTSSSSSSRRFIPACAGNAMVRRTAPAMIAVHPRMRGERHKEP